VISIEQRKVENARLGEAEKGSADYLSEFKAACRDLLPKITLVSHQTAALDCVHDALQQMRAASGVRRDA
jgi:hypothetical protein